MGEKGGRAKLHKKGTNDRERAIFVAFDILGTVGSWNFLTIAVLSAERSVELFLEYSRRAVLRVSLESFFGAKEGEAYDLRG